MEKPHRGLYKPNWEKLYVLTCISETGTGFVNFKESKKLTI
jgi:hypothetical protein